MKPLCVVWALCVALMSAPVAADPIASLPDLATVRVYEITFVTSQVNFAPADPRLAARLGDPLSASNTDFSFVDQEFYDAFYSDANGAPNPLGAYLTIDGVWRQPNLRPDGGMNINEVELVFGGATPHSQFGDFVSSFRYGSIRDETFGANFIPGSEVRAVDHDLNTFPRFGQTSTADLADRFSLTIGFNGIPEPASGVLMTSALAVVHWRRRYRALRPSLRGRATGSRRWADEK